MTDLINAIIVEDETLLAHGLHKMLLSLCPEINVVSIAHNAQDALHEISKHHPELVFLDISLPGKNAFDLLSEMKTINFDIIFITAHDSYSIKAFKYNAIDYLLKPVVEDELVNAVNKAISSKQKYSNAINIDALMNSWKTHHFENMNKLCLPVLNGFQIIEIEQIIYCEASDSYTIFYLTDNIKVIASKPLSEYSNLLENNNFFRIHRSYLINMEHIRSYAKGEGGVVTMRNGAEIEVSRRKKVEFLTKINLLYKS